MSQELDELRTKLVAAARKIYSLGLVTGTSGNLSARLPGSDEVLITPSGVDYEGMNLPDLVVVDLDGNVIEGRLKPSVDTMNHVGIYKVRPDVNGVIHTHSPYAAAFSTLHKEIPCLITEAAGYIGGPVRVMEYLPPATPELGYKVAQWLKNDRAILMPNHGVMAVGESIEKALHAAVSVEESAQVAFIALQLGEPVPVSESEVKRMNDFIHHRYGQR